MYPNTVDIEFCHKHQVWRAFDKTKIVAYNTSDKELELTFPHRIKVEKRETISSGSDKRDMCRLHWGEWLPRGNR